MPTLRRSQRTLRRLQRTLRHSILRQSELDIVIPPEISNDNFARLIRQLAAEPTVHTVLEIGSSSGAGSTAQLVAGLGEKEKTDLYCLELSSARFAELSKRYRHVLWVHCYNVSSVPLEKMPTEADVEEFFTTHPDSPIHRFKLKQVQRWLKQDIDYMRNAGAFQNGIDVARRDAGVLFFDLVLIDGSEFTGEPELDELYGAKYILLDDTMTFKNWVNYERLSIDSNYELLEEDQSCRNGFAAFKHR